MTYWREILPSGKGGWCWDDVLEIWMYRLLYWKEVLITMVLEQVKALKRLFFTSGFASKERGRHLNIKRKWMRY